jgi:NADPH-dependent 2,4-dienoyl-CoA reductase/sulfur reductase-like enzyme
MKRIIFAALLLAGRPYAFGNPPAVTGAKLGRYDVVAYGATPGGIAAAIAAAREGASALLIEPSGHIGGMTAGGLSTADTGKEETIGGISREFFARADAKYNDPMKTATPFEFWKSEPRCAWSRNT